MKIMKLLKDILLQKQSSVTKVWVLTGHIFVLLEEGRKLIGFDTRNICRVQTSSDKVFETTFETSLIDILLTRKSSHEVYFLMTSRWNELGKLVPVVLKKGEDFSMICGWIFQIDWIQSNGKLEYWKSNRRLSTWQKTFDHNVCSGQNAEIVSACFQEKLDCVFWCEKDQSVDIPVYSICKRYFDDNQQFGPVVHILEKCPQCNLYAAGTSIIISTGISTTTIPVILLWSPVSGHLSFYDGKSWEQGDKWSPQTPCDFRELALKLVVCHDKVSLLQKLKYIEYDQTVSELVAIDEDSNCHILSESLCQKVQLKTSSIEDLQTRSVNKGILCYLANNKLSFVCLKSEKVLSELVLDDLCESVSFLLSNWIAAPFVYISKKDIYCVQRFSRTKLPLNEPEKDAKYLQSNAMLLAYLDQQRNNTDSSCDTEHKLQALMKSWESEKNNIVSTQYSELVNPYIDGYWKIEKLWRNIFNKQSLVENDDFSIESEVMRLVQHTSSLPLSVRQTHLILLSDCHPKKVLDILLQKIGLEAELVGDGQSSKEKQIDVQKWQCLLLSENTSTPISGDVSIPLFEHLCGLLLKEKPEHLVLFLAFTQKIHDQAVGISAFVRKKQAYQYYERALACLPDPEKLVMPQAAVKAIADIILKSECKHHRLKAVKLLTKHKLWMDALGIAEQSSGDQQLCSQLLHIILDNLSQDDELGLFVERIISIIPSAEIFIRIFSLLEGSEKCQTEASVFCHSTHDISIERVSPLIGSLLVKKVD